jgi:hypothetical protein
LKTGEIGPGWFLKVASAMLQTFQKIIVHRKQLYGFKTGEIAPGQFSKALDAARQVCHPIGAKDLSLPVSKGFGQIKKPMARQLRTFISI